MNLSILAPGVLDMMKAMIDHVTDERNLKFIIGVGWYNYTDSTEYVISSIYTGLFLIKWVYYPCKF